VGAGGDRGEDLAQCVADCGVEGAGVWAGCGLDPQDFLCGAECAEEVWVGGGVEFGEDVTGDERFVCEVRQLGGGIDVELGKAFEDAMTCERERGVRTVNEGEVCKLLGPSGENAEARHSWSAPEVDEVLGLGRDVSEGEFG
jgi:hypothetical protein